jgi:acetolactate synthase-1/2/3 large subunit
MTAAREPRGADAVVRALEDEDVPFAFGIPGTHNIELYDRLAESDRVRPILVTDEQSASFMADGLWRASGKLGCVNVVPGAGLTHALSGIAEAFMDNVPMLVLGCGIRRDLELAYQLHDIDQVGIARPVTKATLRPARGADVYPTIRHACSLARAGAPGPVMVEVSANLYLRPGHDPLCAGEAGTLPAIDPTPPESGWSVALQRAADLLARARRPLLYLGAGAAGAGEGLVHLAEAMESPVATTLQGKGVFPESHPLFLWPGFGEAAPPFAREVARGCDATLAVGCRFSEVGTGSYGVDPPGPLVHIDIDPAVPGRNYPAEVRIVADAADFVPALLERLRELGGESGSDAGLRAAIGNGRARARDQALTGSASGVTPARLLEELQTRLGAETVYATDSGNGTFLAAECLLLDRPGRFLAPVDYSCMGYSVPAAIGAALGRPGTAAVALVGDGAFLMTGLEMLTAAQQRLPVAFVILRDRELAQIAQFQDTAYNRKACSILPDYSVETIARGVGVAARPLKADEDIPEAVEWLAARLTGSQPAVLDVAIDYSRKTYFTRGVVKTNFGRLPWKDRLRVLGRALGRRLTG